QPGWPLRSGRTLSRKRPPARQVDALTFARGPVGAAYTLRAMRRLVIGLVFVGACGSPPAPTAPPAPRATAAPVCPPPAESAPAFASVEDLAKELVARMNAKDAKAVFALYSRVMQDEFPLAVTHDLVEGTINARGKISDVTRKEGDLHNGLFALKA